MRFNPYSARPGAYQAVLSLNRELREGRLEHGLRALVEIRVSQLNRCGYCLALHSDSARHAGVSQAKLDTLAGWREDSAFTTRERAALGLSESLTVLSGEGVADEVWDLARSVFDDEEIGDLLYLIGIMNLFNRLNVAAQFPADFWREHGLPSKRDHRVLATPSGALRSASGQRS